MPTKKNSGSNDHKSKISNNTFDKIQKRLISKQLFDLKEFVCTFPEVTHYEKNLYNEFGDVICKKIIEHGVYTKSNYYYNDDHLLIELEDVKRELPKDEFGQIHTTTDQCEKVFNEQPKMGKIPNSWTDRTSIIHNEDGLAERVIRHINNVKVNEVRHDYHPNFFEERFLTWINGKPVETEYRKYEGTSEKDQGEILDERMYELLVNEMNEYKTRLVFEKSSEFFTEYGNDMVRVKTTEYPSSEDMKDGNYISQDPTKKTCEYIIINGNKCLLTEEIEFKDESGKNKLIAYDHTIDKDGNDVEMKVSVYEDDDDPVVMSITEKKYDDQGRYIGSTTTTSPEDSERKSNLTTNTVRYLETKDGIKYSEDETVSASNNIMYVERSTYPDENGNEVHIHEKYLYSPSNIEEKDVSGYTFYKEFDNDDKLVEFGYIFSDAEFGENGQESIMFTIKNDDCFKTYTAAREILDIKSDIICRRCSVTYKNKDNNVIFSEQIVSLDDAIYNYVVALAKKHFPDLYKNCIEDRRSIFI